jgi:non-canonical purine NTP pyrophosphatase (RdgB/HAM1 family)
MIKKIIFVTGNEMKVRHANTAVEEFGYTFVPQKLDIIEPREEDPERVVIEKAVQAIQKLNKPLIVEDSGIFIESLNGFPKTFIHFVESTIGIKNILKMMEGVENRKVEFRQSLAYIEPGMKEPKVFSYVDGGYTLADRVWVSKYGDTGEFDKILIPPGETQPLCMFSKEWRAKRDVEVNEETIHYRQLARWLESRG